MSETDITLEAPCRGRCIVSATRDLDGRTHQIIEPWPLEFVGNVRRHIGQQKVPITPRVVLTKNAMQCELRACWGWGLPPSRGGWILLRWGWGGVLLRDLYRKAECLPGSNRATRSPAGLRTSAASALSSYLEMRLVLHVYKDCTLRR